MLIARLRFREERGAVLITSVLFLALAVLPFMVFVVDVGNWWVHKRHLQLQVDAAVLAGGDLFGECFSNNGGPSPNANQTMQTEANKYSGVNGPYPSQYNGQIGGANQGSFPDLLFNNQKWANGEVDPDWGTAAFPASADACTSQVFDVKASEKNLPLFFNSIVPFLDVVPWINRHARVQLFQEQVSKGLLPIAVPDTSPSNVFVTLWNMTTGLKIGDYPLPAPPTSSGSPNYLNKWTGQVPLSVPTLPADNEIGIRVGVGNTGPPNASCWNTAGVDGSYQCYDQGPSTPLVVIRGYDSTTAVVPTIVSGLAFPAPILRGVTETTCADPFIAGSFSPFFSADVSCNTPAPATVTANIDWPSCGGFSPCTFSVIATDANGNTQTRTAPNCGANCYSFSFSYPGGDGQDWVKLSWSYQLTNSPLFRCGGSFTLNCSGGPVTFLPATPGYHQQAYSADSDLDVSGPVKAVSVSPGYTFAAGTSTTLTVTVGLETNLKSLPVPSPLTVMRVYSRSSNRTSVIGCDGANTSDVVASFESGCKTPYQINPTQSCNPDPMPPGDPDCVPVKQGNLGNSIMKALDTRFGCPANNWTAYTQGTLTFDQLLADTRLIKVMITDASALLGAQGGGNVPVTNYATFYVTGWARNAGSGWKQDCGAPPNDPVPPALASVKSGGVAMWGHYIKFVPPGDTPGTVRCLDPGNNVIPCVPGLVR
jgi:hypothetical protein